MTPGQIIKHFKGEQAAATALGVTRQIVNYWKRMGRVPPATQALIQIKTNHVLKADLKQRPAKPPA